MAGPVGQGSAALAQELGTDKLSIIGVDADQYLTDPKNKNVFLTSVLKKMDATTLAAIKQVVDGTFQGGEVTGTLANEGVGLAPYHDFESKVPAALTTKLDELKQQIIAGTLTTSGTAATPAASSRTRWAGPGSGPAHRRTRRRGGGHGGAGAARHPQGVPRRARQ